MEEPLRGLGDVVAKVTAAVGVQPCGGCKKRQAQLNYMVPFNWEHKAPPVEKDEN